MTFSPSLSVDSDGGAQCEERGALLPDGHAELADVRAESGRERGLRNCRLHCGGKIKMFMYPKEYEEWVHFL